MHQELASLCPPDVQPHTRIIGVCGISDTIRLADPSEDGWFLLDFYLFHHLLRNSDESKKFRRWNQSPTNVLYRNVYCRQSNLAHLLRPEEAGARL